MNDTKLLDTNKLIHSLCGEFAKHNQISPEYYERFDVKRGLRNADGTGVMAGVTQIGSVQGYYLQDGERVPMEGRLIYRGIDVEDLIGGFVSENRFGFEETAYLLLFGVLPTRSQLDSFDTMMREMRTLPSMFTEDMILKAPSRDVMNKLARSVLAMYSYDPDPEDNSLENELRQAMQLIARCPILIAHAYAAKVCYFDHGSLYLHRSQEGMGTAENILYAIRHDNRFTEEEARLLDLCLVLHAEHGGGNNSAFACRVLSSSGTDIYSAISAAVGSLKGPRHGGANKKVREMMTCIESEVSDWRSEDQVRKCLTRIVKKETGDRSGLIYGMGHAIYTLSDPRAKVLKRFARRLAEQKGLADKLELIETVERLSPEVFADVKKDSKPICANVDLYSGFVYEMLNIPEELYTPLFATARMVGWCAHRIEEVLTGGRIIRPAYKAVAPAQPFLPMEQR
ncbi:MAG: citrate/2-methylcitrate synthase [Oscillospiraceae bacterium]|nr:citrate/2-methylcitrate synthase [Oscillospiraceae bacterium]